jgi:hypothetical protein
MMILRLEGCFDEKDEAPLRGGHAGRAVPGINGIGIEILTNFGYW